MDAYFTSSTRFSLCGFAFVKDKNHKEFSARRYQFNKPHRLKHVPQKPVTDCNPQECMGRGKEAGRRKTQGASLLDSAPSLSAGWQWTGVNPAPQPPRRDCLRRLRRKILLHLSHGPPKLLGTSARLLIASAPLPGRPQDIIHML